MYERSVARNCRFFENVSRVSLFSNFLWLSFDFICCFGCVFTLVQPIVNGNLSASILFNFVSHLQTWWLVLSKYIMKTRCTNSKFGCNSPLCFIIVFHPFCEFIHLITFFYIFLWTKIRNSDTLESIPSNRV